MPPSQGVLDEFPDAILFPADDVPEWSTYITQYLTSGRPHFEMMNRVEQRKLI